MTEKSPPNSDKKDPLFYMGPGYQGDTVRYPEDVEPSEPYQDTDPGPPKKLLEMTPQEMIEVALLDRVVPDIYGHIDPKRDEFTRAGHHWTPYSEMEVTSAIGTDRFSNPPLVAYVLGAQRNGGREAVKKVLNSVDSARAQSIMDIELLREIQDLRTGEFNPKGARFNPYVIQVLAKAIFARNSFNLFDWPNHYLERSKRIKPNPKVDTALQGISDKLPTLSDEELSFLCQRTLVHQQARLAFFADQMDKVKEHADTEDIATAARIHV
jgi:hypothetical protein